MIGRRGFLRLVGVGAASLAAPITLFREGPCDKLDQICARIGRFVRDRSIKPSQVIVTNEFGRVVVAARPSMNLSDGTFHVADRDLNYTRLHYQVEPQYLSCADKVFLYIHTEDELGGPYTFWLIFAKRDRCIGGGSKS